MSEKSLDKLIESIKTEAIESARDESSKILEDAQAKAERIVRSAEEQKKQMIEDAKAEAEAIIQKGESALEQAARDLNVAVRNDLVNLLSAVLDKEVNKEFTPDLLKTAIVKVVENIGTDVELRMSEDFEEELATYIHDELKSSADLVSIRKDPGVLKGLSVSHTTEGWSYEITPEEVAGLLKNHLTGHWATILQNSDNA